jgi:hypothetical protein
MNISGKGQREPIIQQIKERKWEVDRALLEERFTSDRETSSQF